LAEHGGSLRFTSGLDTVNHVLAESEDAPSVEVPVTTMDELVGADVPALIKIDVEGFEHAVLAGARRTLADPRLLAVIMETNGSGVRYGARDDELVAVMAGNGFAPFDYDPFVRELVPGAVSSGNTIFVRAVAELQERVRAAPRFELVNGSI